MVTSGLGEGAEPASIEAPNPHEDGPERRTWIEVLLDWTRLPRPIAALVLSVLLGPPGVILAGAWATGSWPEGLERSFGGLAPEARSAQILVQASFWLMYALGFWLVPRLRQAVLRAEAGLVGCLPGGEPQFHALFGRIASPLPAILVGGVMAVASYDYIQGILWPSHGIAWSAYHVLRILIFNLMVGTLAWIYGAGLWGLHRFGAVDLRLPSLARDPMLGLKPAGALALELARAYLLYLMAFALPALFGPVIPAYAPMIALLLSVGLSLFFLPLLRLRQKILAAKERSLARLRREVLLLAGLDSDRVDEEATIGTPKRPRERETSRDRSETAVLEAMERVARIQTLDLAGRKIEAGPSWPFDMAIARRLGALTTPVLLALLTDLVRRMLSAWMPGG